MEEMRRPIKARDTKWAAAVAGFLVRRSVRPNSISLASVGFAAVSGGCLAATSILSKGWAPWLYVGSAVLMQARLLCNLFDGMVAIEGGFKTKSGGVFNELPDRFADAFILIGAGYAGEGAEHREWLGWLSAVLAVLTAYVRALGASLGASQQFCGPMAKPQRMAVMTVGCALCALLQWTGIRFSLMPWVTGIIALGCVVTVVRRTMRIIHELDLS